jgi:hypothetical protein
MNKHLLLALLFIPMIAGCDPYGFDCSQPCPEDEDVKVFGLPDVYSDSSVDVSGPDTSSE